MAHAAPGLGLLVGWLAGQSGWGIGGYNPDMRKLSALAQISVISRVNSLPDTPTNGDMYLLIGDSNSDLADSNSQAGSNSAGVGYSDGAVAVYDEDSNSDADWYFYTPRFGWRCYVQDEDAEYLYTVDSVWVLQAGGAVAASGVSYDSGDPGDSNSTAANVQDALDSLYARTNVLAAAIAGIGGDDSNSSDGPATAYDLPYDSGDPGDSNSTATTVGAALDQLFAELNALTDIVGGGDDSNSLDGGGGVDASSVTYANSLDSNSDAATTVETALNELFTRPYPVGVFVEGSASDVSKTRHHVVALACYIPIDFTGSVGWAEDGDDTDLVIQILKNGTLVGTITFAADSNSVDANNTVTFSAEDSNSGTEIAFVPGDRMSFVMPSSFGTWNDIGFTVLAYRTV